MREEKRKGDRSREKTFYVDSLSRDDRFGIDNESILNGVIIQNNGF